MGVNPNAAPQHPGVHLRTCPAREGLSWLVTGLHLVRRQPLALLSMAVIYLLMHLPAVLPVLGMAITTVLTPFATLGFMAACREVTQGHTPTPAVYFTLFQNKAQRRGLIQLGVANAIFTVASLALMLLVGLMQSPPSATVNTDTPLQIEWANVALTLVFYLPIAVLMWFSPMLVGWHGTPLAQALFGSAVACWRNKGAFLVFGLANAGLLFAVGMAVQLLLTALGASRELTAVFVAPLALAVLAVFQASIYAMYTAIFPSTRELDDSPGVAPPQQF